MFHNCKSIEDIKSLYRKLSLRLHPDLGGEAFLMILLTESYEIALESIKPVKQDKKTKIPTRSGTGYEITPFDILKGDDYLKIIDEIYEYAKTHPKFSLTFIDSINAFLSESGFITASQFNSLVKIYYSFRMDKK
jgi:hypothetical protein